MTTALATASVPANPTPLEEALRPSEWAALLDLSPRRVQQIIQRSAVPTQLVGCPGGTTNIVAFAHLPEAWRVELDALRVEHYCRTFADLLTVGARWVPKVEVGPGDMTAHNYAYAQSMKAALTEFFAALDARQSVAEAYEIAIRRWEAEARSRNPELQRARESVPKKERAKYRPLKATYGWRQIENIRQRVEAAGGIRRATLQAYALQKQVPHVGARVDAPEELIAELKCRATRFGEWNQAVRTIQIDWQEGRAVPGVGRAEHPGEEFPIKRATLDKYKPSAAARVLGSRGKFKAKADGWLPAPLLGTRTLRLRERIVYDDKRIDGAFLDDHTGDPVELVAYFAMDESTRQILGYILRETGAVRQTDVEALCAFIMRTAGIAGHCAGYPTTHKYERGCVAISPARQEFLEAIFPGEVIISRTTMIGGKTGPGQHAQKASGNFFGKGKLEAFNGALDHYLLHLPGQRGNVYQNQPAMLGDLLLTPQKMTHPNYKPTGSAIEEAVLCAQSARTLAFVQTGEMLPAHQASEATGVTPNLLYVSQANAAIQTMIAWWNSERGHRREGFEQIAIVKADGSRELVTESPNDKAARLEAALRAQGRGLQRISEADMVMLLHKVKRVTVKPSGAKVRIGGADRIYWSGSSKAVAAAQASALQEKTYLALYNPEDATDLYLLENCPSHLSKTATELPGGEKPIFFERLPLYTPAEDDAARVARAEQVQRNHSRVAFEHNRNIQPFVADETARRERNLSIGEPLAKAVTALRAEAEERAASETAASLQVVPETRAAQRASAQPDVGTADDFRASLQSDR